MSLTDERIEELLGVYKMLGHEDAEEYCDALDILLPALPEALKELQGVRIKNQELMHQVLELKMEIAEIEREKKHEYVRAETFLTVVNKQESELAELKGEVVILKSKEANFDNLEESFNAVSNIAEAFYDELTELKGKVEEMKARIKKEGEEYLACNKISEFRATRWIGRIINELFPEPKAEKDNSNLPGE